MPSDLALLSRDQKLLQYAALLRQEKERRLSGAPLPNPWTKYLDNPAGFFTDSLKYFIWSKQREICQALVDHDRVAVKSCHESGKSFTAGGLVGWWIAVHPPNEAMVVTTAPTFNQVRAILWREVNRVRSRGNLPGHTNQTEWLINNELVALGRKPVTPRQTLFRACMLAIC